MFLATDKIVSVCLCGSPLKAEDRQVVIQWQSVNSGGIAQSMATLLAVAGTLRLTRPGIVKFASSWKLMKILLQ